MTVVKDVTRVAFEITWDTSIVTGSVANIRAHNPEDVDDTNDSTRDGLVNDGKAVWTVPHGYNGTVDFTVTDENGNTDTGSLDFGDVGTD